MNDPYVQLIIEKIDTLHKCLDEHVRTSAEWRQKIETQLNEQDKRLDLIDHEATRTRQTVDSVESAVRTAKTMKTLVSWVSAITIGVASTWFAIKSFWTNQSPL